MKRILCILFVLFVAVCIMAAGPGPTKPPPEKTQPPPVETEPAETEPPVIPTERQKPSQEPQEGPQRTERPDKVILLPSSGYGPPQTAPACASMLLALVMLAWKVLR